MKLYCVEKRTVGNVTHITSSQSGLVLSDIVYEYNDDHSIKKETKVQSGVTTISEHAYNLSDELIETSVTENGVTSTKLYFINTEGNKIETDVTRTTYKNSEYNYLNQLVKFDDGTHTFEYVYDVLRRKKYSG